MSTVDKLMIPFLLNLDGNAKLKRFFPLLTVLVLLFIPLSLHAQDEPPPDNPPASETLIITKVDASRLPMIQLQGYGRTAAGESINLTNRRIVGQHGGQPINEIQAAGKESEGTLTIFLVDTPAGVEGQLDNIRQAILSFTAAPFMQEQVDYVAVYQVTAVSAQPLLEPTPFYNSVINFFVDPLPIQSGPTALFDSLGGLLDMADELRPAPDLPVSIVVFSDGTDVVSNRFTENSVIAAAAEKGIPVHTILVGNENLTGSGLGSDFLTRLATATGGVPALLTDNPADDLGSVMWGRIVSFREQTVLRYTLSDPQPGVDIPVTISLADNQATQVATSVTIPETAGFITIPLPPDSQSLVLPDPAEGVNLAFPTESRWLDGQNRTLMAAQLWVNNAPVADLNPADMSPAEVFVPNLQIGRNEVWINGVDEIGQQVGGPVVVLNVEQGDRRVIPAALAPAGFSGWAWVLGCLSVLILAAALVYWRWPVVAAGGWRENVRLPSFDFSTRPRRRSRAVDESASGEPGGKIVRDSQQLTPAGHALDVVDSTTLLVSPIGLKRSHVRLGRSPNQSDIVFDQDMTMSRLHASLSQEGQSYRLFDEGSTSGSFVNDQPVPQYGTLLMDGDEILLGAVRLRFRIVWDINSQI